MAAQSHLSIENKVSVLVDNQLPEFIQSEGPKFVTFLKKYYEFLESNELSMDTVTRNESGILLETTSLSADSTDRFLLEELTTGTATDKLIYESTRSGTITFSSGETITGSSSGATATVDADKNTLSTKIYASGITQTDFSVGEIITGSTSLATANVVSYRRNPIWGSESLLTLIDVDDTPSSYLDYFRKEFLEDIPTAAQSNKRLILKHITDVYRTKGTEASFQFLFRSLYSIDDLELYFPKKDVLKLSDGVWSQDKSIRIDTTDTTADFTNRTLTGNTSEATAQIDKVETFISGATTITELFVTDISGTFDVAEIVTSSIAGGASGTGTALGVVSSIDINDGGTGHEIGNELVFSGGDAVEQATAKISAIGTGKIANFIFNDGGDGYVNATPLIIINTGTGGTGSAGRISSIHVTETIDINDDVVADFSEISLDASAYGLSGNTVGNATHNTIGNILGFTATETGSINSLSVITSGEGYEALPAVSVTSNSVFDLKIPAAPLLNIYDIGSNTFFIGETITGGTSGATGNIISVNSGNTQLRFISKVNAGATTLTKAVSTNASFTATVNGFYDFANTNGNTYFTIKVESANSTFSTYSYNVFGFTANTGGQEAQSVVEFVTSIPITQSVTRPDQPLGNTGVSVKFVANTGDSAAVGDKWTFNLRGFELNEYITSSNSTSPARANVNSTSNVVIAGGTKGACANVAAGQLAAGTIRALEITNPGLGYTSAPTIDMSSLGDGNANLTAQTGVVVSKAGSFKDDRGQLSSTKIVQDSLYYQDYSYVIRAENSIDDYRKTVRKLLHPAGQQLFGEMQVPRQYLYLNQDSPHIIITEEGDDIIMEDGTQGIPLGRGAQLGSDHFLITEEYTNPTHNVNTFKVQPISNTSVYSGGDITVQGGNTTINGITTLSGTTTVSSSTTLNGVKTTTDFVNELEVGDKIYVSSDSTKLANVTAITDANTLTTNVAVGDGSSQSIYLRTSFSSDFSANDMITFDDEQAFNVSDGELRLDANITGTTTASSSNLIISMQVTNATANFSAGKSISQAYDKFSFELISTSNVRTLLDFTGTRGFIEGETVYQGDSLADSTANASIEFYSDSNNLLLEESSGGDPVHLELEGYVSGDILQISSTAIALADYNVTSNSSMTIYGEFARSFADSTNVVGEDSGATLSLLSHRNIDLEIDTFFLDDSRFTIETGGLLLEDSNTTISNYLVNEANSASGNIVSYDSNAQTVLIHSGTGTFLAGNTVTENGTSYTANTYSATPNGIIGVTTKFDEEVEVGDIISLSSDTSAIAEVISISNSTLMVVNANSMGDGTASTIDIDSEPLYFILESTIRGNTSANGVNDGVKTVTAIGSTFDEDLTAGDIISLSSNTSLHANVTAVTNNTTFTTNVALGTGPVVGANQTFVRIKEHRLDLESSNTTLTLNRKFSMANIFLNVIDTDVDAGRFQLETTSETEYMLFEEFTILNNQVGKKKTSV